ncbi:MAG: hypothetical protein GQ542_08810 [Desulforhopalus sp.]|nr:hypothetical protein [Desulforhopalus sp.]
MSEAVITPNRKLNKYQRQEVKRQMIKVVELVKSDPDRELIQLREDNLFRTFERRKRLLEGTLSVAKVAKLLGVSRQTVHHRVKAQTLLGLKDKNTYRFPMWQFDGDGPNGIIPELPKSLKALNISNFGKAFWLSRENAVLDNKTPIDMLKEGEYTRVLIEARSIGAAAL